MADTASLVTLPLLEWVEIPAGSVTFSGFEHPFEVKPFKIARYPVTNAQFEAFIQDSSYKNDAWWEGLAQKGGSPRASDWRDLDCPKLEVCWFEAIAFCRWLADKIRLSVRLPTEWEWQWAAVGDSGWAYPYGSTFDSQKCNTRESEIGRTNAVTQYDTVKTYFNTVDMAGNVWEWCLNSGSIPDDIQMGGYENRTLCGGSWKDAANTSSAAFRSRRSPRTRTFNIGFRVMIDNQS